MKNQGIEKTNVPTLIESMWAMYKYNSFRKQQNKEEHVILFFFFFFFFEDVYLLVSLVHSIL
jgi:hypothetical protein